MVIDRDNVRKKKRIYSNIMVLIISILFFMDFSLNYVFFRSNLLIYQNTILEDIEIKPSLETMSNIRLAIPSHPTEDWKYVIPEEKVREIFFSPSILSVITLLTSIFLGNILTLLFYYPVYRFLLPHKIRKERLNGYAFILSYITLVVTRILFFAHVNSA